MKLRQTKLCINCEALYEDPGPCPDCASEVFLWLSPVLGTALTKEEVEVQNYEPIVKDNIPQAAVFLENPLLFLGKSIARRTRFLLLAPDVVIKGRRKIARRLGFVATRIPSSKARAGLRL